MHATRADTNHDEARRELSSMVGPAKLGGIVSELLVDHLLAAYGDAGWPVLRDAARALLRRIASTEREQLRVSSRPARHGWRGRYQTGRKRRQARPYTTTVFALRPLHVACDCLDYQQGSLGICKHGVAVLRDLAARPRVLARAVEHASRAPGPAAWWSPIRAMDGAGDWLEGVRLPVDTRATPGARRLFVPIEDPSGRALAVAISRVSSAPSRTKVLQVLEASTARRRDRDPALAAWLARETEVQARREALHLTPAAQRRHLRGFRLRLYPYQRASLDRFSTSGRLLLADDMGLGKTVQAAAIGHVLVSAGKVERVLVLAPASLKSQWVREWRRATDVPIEPVEGAPEVRKQCYASMKAGVLVANYEQTLRDLEFMRAWAPQLVILDEAQRIKNWATQTAGHVKQLDAPYRLVLTGTPMENRLDELASIMDWVDPFALAPKWRLASTHNVCVDGTREVVGVQRLNVLRTRLAPHMLRRRRNEILSDLPERTDTVRSVAMTPAQQIEHDELKPPIAKLARIAQRRPLTQAEFLRLMSLLTTQRVIANGLGQLNYPAIWPSVRHLDPDEAAIASLSMPKLLHLRDLVESLVIDQDRKVVVFSQWKRALALAGWAVGDLLRGAKLRAAFFTGDESQRRRTQNVVDFHDDPDLRVLWCTDAGGVGLNLQRAASACIHFELPWNPAVFEQRVARLHRLGQPDPVDVYTLVSEESIEGRIAATISGKRAMFTGLFDGETDQVRFEDSGGFLGAVQAVVEPPSITSDPDEADPDADDQSDGEHVEHLVSAADEAAGPAPSEAAAEREPALPAAEEVASLFAQLRVEPRPDGGVHLEASPEAARTLGALFAGMATLLERAQARPGDR